MENQNLGTRRPSENRLSHRRIREDGLVVCKPAVYTNLVDPVPADKVSLSMTTSIQRSLDEGCAPAERYGYVPLQADDQRDAS